MTREDLREIIARVIEQLRGDADGAPTTACVFGDDCDTCDATTKYGIDEED